MKECACKGVRNEIVIQVIVIYFRLSSNVLEKKEERIWQVLSSVLLFLSFAPLPAVGAAVVVFYFGLQKFGPREKKSFPVPGKYSCAALRIDSTTNNSEGGP